MNYLKGQSAIEYLTTYGWMLVVVSIAGTTIYTTVSPQCSSTSGFSSNDLEITDYAVNTENQLNFVIENRAREEVTINSVKIEGKTNQTLNKVIESAGSDTVKASNITKTNTCNTLDVTIKYDSGSLEDIVSEGTISGNFETDTIETPSISSVTQ